MKQTIFLHVNSPSDSNLLLYGFQSTFLFSKLHIVLTNDLNNATLYFSSKHNIFEVYLNKPEILATDILNCLNKNNIELIPAIIAFLLSGASEKNVPYDAFDRQLYKNSILYKVIDCQIPYVDILREIYLKNITKSFANELISSPWKNNQFASFLCHDVDGFLKYRSLLKSLPKILLKPQKFKLRELLASKKDFTTDPYFKGIKYLCTKSKENNLKSNFYFITRNQHKLDNLYNLNSKEISFAKEIIKNFNFDTEMHGAYQSHKIFDFFQQDCATFEEFFLKKPLGVRQHYLSYHLDFTGDIHEKNNFLYDSSIAFPDMIGFRRATCLPYFPYNFLTNMTSSVLQIPLTIMDVTLKNYLKLSPQESINKCSELLNTVANCHGVFTFLWHPGNCSDEWNSWLEQVYEPMLKKIQFANSTTLGSQEIISLKSTL